jgi:sugar (pentulose or hexulose) kinase
MAATNSVAKRTGNVSAGTSVFAMVVLEDNLKKVHEELDMVTTPDGSPVAMVHVNNCTSDLNAWVNIFHEFAGAYGIETDTNKLFGTLYKKALEGDADCGGLLAYGYLSGEHITGVSEGRPLFARSPQSNFTLANFMRTHLYTAFATLKIGMDILIKEEEVKIDSLLGHGGIFKTAGVAQGILASALDIPVSVMTSAGEGGAWGMALLAAYLVREDKGESLESFLKDKVFAGAEGSSMDPDPATTAGFEKFIETYKKGIAIELAAGDAIA